MQWTVLVASVVVAAALLWAWKRLRGRRGSHRPASPWLATSLPSSPSPDAWVVNSQASRAIGSATGPAEPTGLPVDQLPLGIPGPYGKRVLTPTDNRGGNAGYTNVSTRWRGGWLGLQLP